MKKGIADFGNVSAVSQWLEKKEPGKVRFVFVMRSCNDMRTWQQFMTTVSQ